MAFPVGAAMAAGATPAAGFSIPWGSVLSGVGSAFGGLFGGSRGPKAAEQFTWNLNAQKMFAQQGLRWRVADAKAAGIHPLYALGGSGATYTPSAVSVGGGSDLGASLANAGQDIGRAVSATQTKPERHQLKMEALALERGELENALLRSQIARQNAPQVGPTFPTASGPPTDLFAGVEAIPGEEEAVMPSALNQGAAVNPETQWVRTRDGFQPVPHQRSYEDADIANPSAIPWHWRNLVLPNFGGKGSPPPDHLLPEGAYSWKWSRGSQAYVPDFRPPLSDYISRAARDNLRRFGGR